MSVSITIKEQIISKIDALDSVQKVYPAEKTQPAGWPAVFVTTADLEGEFASNVENSRVYAYDITVMFPEGQDMNQQTEYERLDYSERVVAGVVDDIINSVDTDYELDGSPVLYVNAADCVWGKYEYEGGVAKAAQITLRVYTEKNIS